MKPTGQQFPNLPPVDSENRAVVEIPLSKGYSALIDSEDFEQVSAFKWSAQVMTGGAVYAVRTVQVNNKQTRIYLHRAVLGAGEGILVDHVNRNTLDCRRQNLRPATPQQNVFNRRNSKELTGLRAVASGKWRGCVKVNRRSFYTPTFPCPILAAVHRDLLAKQLHGAFAVLNFTFTPLSAA